MKKVIFYSTPTGQSSYLYELFKRAKQNHIIRYFGVDWAKDSGMSRGDVIKRIDNITFVRFKTVGFGS